MEKTKIKWNSWTGGDKPPVECDMFIMWRLGTVKLMTKKEVKAEDWSHRITKRDIIKYSPIDYGEVDEKKII